MTPEAKAKYDAKWKRIRDTIALTEPDRVPITPSHTIFAILNAGYTVAEVIYDTTLEKAKDAMRKYLLKFDPDSASTLGHNAGEGPMLELQQPTTMRWAGMPGNPISDISLQQYIEFPFLLDDEFDQFFENNDMWTLTKRLPRSSDLLKPLESFKAPGSVRALASLMSRPEYRKMIEDLWKIDEGYREYTPKVMAFNKEMEEMGYPCIRGGGAAVPFDSYSDSLRGTILSLEDLYTNPDEVRRYIDATFEQTIANIRASKGRNDGTFVSMALHKGMDGFMSDSQYREYYWSHLQQIIAAIVEANKVPYIFTEGKYNSRLECLKEVEPGKTIYHFEEVDMAEAKRVLGGTACISGGFPNYILKYGSKQEVIDEAKRLIDICAPGGGFIFETGYGMDYAKEENVEAMFETVKEYGKRS